MNYAMIKGSKLDQERANNLRRGGSLDTLVNVLVDYELEYYPRRDRKQIRARTRDLIVGLCESYDLTSVKGDIASTPWKLYDLDVRYRDSVTKLARAEGDLRQDELMIVHGKEGCNYGVAWESPMVILRDWEELAHFDAIVSYLNNQQLGNHAYARDAGQAVDFGTTRKLLVLEQITIDNKRPFEDRLSYLQEGQRVHRVFEQYQESHTNEIAKKVELFTQGLRFGKKR